MPTTLTPLIRSHTLPAPAWVSTASPLIRASWLKPGTGSAADASSRSPR